MIMELLKNKSQKRFKFIGLSIVGVIVLFSIVSMVIVMIVYNNQFPRYERHDTSISAMLRYEDLEEAYPRRLVNFTSEKNQLQGYVYGNDQNQGLVVVAHGIGGGADSYLPQITYFVDKGWRVFAYDSTGSFDSEGKSTKGFPQALLDMDAALTYINNQQEFNDLPIVLFGHSWGGYAVANVLHYEHEIDGVVSVSGANSPMEMIVEQGQRMMGAFIHTQYPYLWLYQRILFGEEVSLNAVDAINKSDTPVLIIHGENDEMVNYDGSAIISNMDEITNPNAKALTLSDPKVSGHNDLFRSKASIDYIDDVNVEYRQLYDAHEQNIPYEIKQNFYAKIDRALAQDLNLELMDEIHAFFLRSINN